MRRAFTLIELLVVVVIIGIIASLTFVALNGVRVKARDAKRVADISNIQKALEIYKNDNGVYPTYATSGKALVANGQTYMAKIPTAPTNTGLDVYNYTSTSGGAGYSIAYNLEKGIQDIGSGSFVALPGRIATVPVLYTLRGIGPSGGSVFRITEGGLHGLEAAPDTKETVGAPWGCFYTLLQGADGTAIGTGQQNTTDIVNNCAQSGTAARLADSLSFVNNGVTYNDWYLPSELELIEMYTQLKANNIGNFATDMYWSSTEIDEENSRIISFQDGTPTFLIKDSLNYVRPIRSF